MKISLALQITLLRIILTPIIVGCIWYKQLGIALMLYVFAVFTDYLDGFIARKYHQESRLGQLLDPIADKILIMSLMYVLFVGRGSIYVGCIDVYCLGLFFIAKELILMSAAAALYLRYQHFFKPTFFSRFVSVSEMIIIFNCLLWQAFESISGSIVGFCIEYYMIVTVFLSVVLLVQYAVSVVQLLRKKL